MWARNSKTSQEVYQPELQDLCDFDPSEVFCSGSFFFIPENMNSTEIAVLFCN